MSAQHLLSGSLAMKLIKTRLRSRLSDLNLEYLIKIAIEGPPLTDFDFEEILRIFNFFWEK